jgi:recombination protein RecT
MNAVTPVEGATEVVERPKEKSLGAQLKDRQSNFVAALPAHIPVERFMRVVMTAAQNNPSLQHADRPSLFTSCMRAAQDGLLPDGREGALVIYKTKDGDAWIAKVQWMPMIAGLRKKARNSGEIVSWEAQVVYAKDHFEFELGDDPFIKHKPFMGGEPGPVIAAYSVATLKGGEKSREIMTRAQIDKVRAASKSPTKGPWVEWFDEMARKTVARRHSKVLPMSTDLDDLIRRDDDLYDMAGARDDAKAVAGPKARTLAGRLDMIAGPADASEDAPAHDPETGDVTQETTGAEPATNPPAAKPADTAATPAAGLEKGTSAQPTKDAGAATSPPAMKAPASGPRETADDFPGDRPSKMTPVALARQRGAEACRTGEPLDIMPLKYRDPKRRTESSAWQEGWNDEAAR